MPITLTHSMSALGNAEKLPHQIYKKEQYY